MDRLAFAVRATAVGLWRGTLRPLARPSWTRRQAILVEFIRAYLEQLQGRSGPDQQRLTSGLPQRLPRDLGTREAPLAGRPALWLTPTAGHERTLLHFHGGGYVIGAPQDALPYLSRIVREGGVRVVSVDYRLAPQHPFPAALDDACAAVHALVADGVPPEHLFIGGDSAGGGLSLAALLRLRDEGGPQVAGAVLGSPWLELDVARPPGVPPSRTDFLLEEMTQDWARHYAGDADPADPLLSPGRADLSGLPPLLFLAGGAEILEAQIARAAASARASGVDTEVVTGPDAVHTWYMLPGALPGPDVMSAIVDFLRR